MPGEVVVMRYKRLFNIRLAGPFLPMVSLLLLLASAAPAAERVGGSTGTVASAGAAEIPFPADAGPEIEPAGAPSGSTSASVSVPSPHSSVRSPAATPAELEARIRTILGETRTPGLIGAVVYGDEVVWQGAMGIADRSTNRPVTTSTRFRIGSVSKMFISLAVLRLVEQGRLSLEDPLRKLVPEIGIENPWEETDPVRLVHVLEHTSGFDDLRFRDYGFKSSASTLLEGLRNNIGSKTCRWRPGTRAAYSNIGPPTAALAVEQVTGMPYRDFVAREVFAPLGMGTASYVPGPDLAVSYRANGVRVPYSHLPVRPGGALGVTSNDMIRLLRFFHGRGTLEGQTVLTSASIERMERPASILAARAGIRVGMGLGNIATGRGGFLFQGHTGGIESFSSAIAYLPEHGRGYFFAVNGGEDQGFSRIEKEMIAFLTRDLTPAPAPPVVPVPEDQLRALEGVYQPDSPRMDLTAGPISLLFETVRFRDGALHIGAPWTGSQKLRPVGNNLFLVGDQPIPRAAFVRTPEGHLLAQSDQRSLRRVPALLAYGRTVSVLLSVPILLSTLLFAPVWMVRKVSGRLRGVPHLSLRVLPFAGTVVLLMTIVLVKGAVGGGNLGTPNIWSVGLFAGSLLFAFFSALAVLNLAVRFRHRREVNRLAFAHSVLATLAMMTLTLFLASSGLLGLRTWAY